MRYKTVTVITNHQDAELVSSAMFDMGVGGVSILDKQDFLDLIKSDVIWDYVDENVLNQTDDVKVSTVIDETDNEFVHNLTACLEEMKKIGGLTYGEILTDVIDDVDYLNEWKKYYKPIKSRYITIVPTWIKYQAEEGETVMRLDPGMAFGTGSHATTRMCLDCLSDVKGKSVIDVGCGSGILGIAAALLGAESVYMCDVDESACKFAKENAILNKVDVEIECADLLQGDRKADIVLANITADILMRLAKDLYKHLNKGATVIISGIIDSRLDEVKRCFESCGYEILDVNATDDWRAMKLRFKG